MLSACGTVDACDGVDEPLVSQALPNLFARSNREQVLSTESRAVFVLRVLFERAFRSWRRGLGCRRRFFLRWLFFGLLLRRARFLCRGERGTRRRLVRKSPGCPKLRITRVRDRRRTFVLPATGDRAVRQAASWALVLASRCFTRHALRTIRSTHRGRAQPSENGACLKTGLVDSGQGKKISSRKASHLG